MTRPIIRRVEAAAWECRTPPVIEELPLPARTRWQLARPFRRSRLLGGGEKNELAAFKWNPPTLPSLFLRWPVGGHPHSIVKQERQ
jgi:hypothetical protein